MRVRQALILGAGVLSAAAFGGPASAGKLHVLYTFCSTGTCTDGANPVGLTGDGKGTLYGITYYGGGSGNSGTIFKISGESFQILYTINCSQGGTCPDGYVPAGELVLDKAGNLYGTMQQGGANNAGTLFELTSDGQYHVLYNFCSSQSCTDGGQPSTPLTYVGANRGALYDGVSPLYGTTLVGGSTTGNGVAYTFTLGSSEQVVYDFCPDQQTCKGGGAPSGEVTMNGSGTLYGTAGLAGKQGFGTIWSVDPDKGLFSFCDATCKEGNLPVGVFLDPDAPTLYGATTQGGKPGAGVAFAYDLSAKKFSVLHTFCSKYIQIYGCVDGSEGSSAPYPDGAGGVIGTTLQGGAIQGVAYQGTLYRIDLATRKLKILYDFCHPDSCSDGAQPQGHLVQYRGSIYGVTKTGGNGNSCNGFGCGVVYQYK